MYIDPPFATKGDFSGSGDEKSYADKIVAAEFIEGVRERLIYLRDLLAEDGSIYVHLDYKMSHYIKIILDEVFGKNNFRNDIIWFYRRWTAASDSFQNMHESILWYSKTKQYNLNKVHVEPTEGQKKKHRKGWDRNSVYIDGEKRPQLIVYNKEKVNKAVQEGRIDINEFARIVNVDITKTIAPDVWEINYINSQAKERVDYPTQKPEALLERIIQASSNPGDLVMDVFAGSGTTAAVAEKLGRRWVACDFGKHAIYTMQKRMAEIADSRKLEVKDKKKKVRYGRNPEPFCIVSVGAFDFSKIMNLRQNRDAYISFVLGIFGITERDDSLAARYRVSNVCALKDGNPVEVFPVWDDDYLHNVRVDEEYLQDIIVQSGGRLKGIYYLVAPENCVRVGDTELRNENGDRVDFKILAFPYKVLEEVSRNFSIEEQPNTPENINKLTSSIGFYFNEEVSVQAHQTGKGLRIADFGTSILDSSGNRYQGLEGLAMLLVDKDYTEENGFTVDVVIYAQNVKDNEAIVKGITENTAVIAIDRHGNESPVTRLSKE
ncbi:MAG: site-specific DNA-methyltransferase [Desulfobia sp.]